MLDVWSRSSFRVTGCWLPQCWCRQNNWSCTEISPFTDCNKTHFCCKFVIHSLDMKPFYWFQWYKWLKMDCKMSLVFLTASFDITEDFHILHSAYKVTYTFVIPSLKQKLTTVSLTHTHTNPSTTTHKKQLGMSHLLLMVISLAQKLLLCAKFRPLWVKKLDWLWGRLQVCSNEGMFQAFALVWRHNLKRTPSQNWGNLLSVLHVPHTQCLAGISNPFSASFTGIWTSFPRFYCSPSKACLLCTTPAGTYRVQSPGFL